MAAHIKKSVVQEIYRLREEGLSVRGIARKLGISRSTSHRHCKDYDQGRTFPDLDEDEIEVDKKADPVEIQRLQDTITRLKREIRDGRREESLSRIVRAEACGLAEYVPRPPAWSLDSAPRRGCVGCPTLLLSDWHWGETVDPRAMFNLNDYSMKIAACRAKTVAERTIRVLRNDIVSKEGYPGIVVALGGDMISGSIHPELVSTDEVPPAAQCADLVDHLIATIETLAYEFGKVYVPCVTGNHGRATFKPWHKRRVETSYDWLAYTFLERHFKDDDRVVIHVSQETDVIYTLHRTKYLLTHGDSLGVRGGNGIIGAIGPIMRGVRKLQSTNADIGRSFDVAIMGHWHQYITLRNVIVNGSLKGYCEYARANRFSYEPARHALWITHPKHGVTISTSVLAQDEPPKNKQRREVFWMEDSE